MAKAIAEISGQKLYYVRDLGEKFLEITCSNWVCPIVKRDLLKGLFPVFPEASYGFGARFKSFFGIYRKHGVMGFFTPKSKRIYIILSQYMRSFLKKIDPAVISVTAHEYQHAAFTTTLPTFLSTSKEFITAWYVEVFRQLLEFKFKPSMTTFVESTVVPTLIKGEKSGDDKLAIQLWSKLAAKYDEFRTIARFISGKRISTEAYRKYIFMPCLRSYIKFFQRKHTPYAYELASTMYYQEFIFPSEVQAIKASLYPNEHNVVANAKATKLG